MNKWDLVKLNFSTFRQHSGNNFSAFEAEEAVLVRENIAGMLAKS